MRYQEISVLPHGRPLEIPRGRRVSKAQVLKTECMKPNWKFYERWGGGGRGLNPKKKPSLGGEGGMGIFWNNIITMCKDFIVFNEHFLHV